jgi:tetratricopeptide (TPR) repeat protein
MPALENLDERLRDNPEQEASFRRNLELARLIADRMPLVHVTGKGVPFVVTLSAVPSEIPTSEDLNYCSEATRRAENLLNLSPSVYFYAGRACDDFGNVAIAYDPSVEADHTISVTPFDTGGLIHEKRLIKCTLNSATDEAALIEFAKASEVAADAWRDEFARFLAAYFRNPWQYWDAAPDYQDPEQLFTMNWDWRAWTFEIRFGESHPVTNGQLAWCASPDMIELLRGLDNTLPISQPGEPESALRQFMNQSPINADGSNDIVEELETWITNHLQSAP